MPFLKDTWESIYPDYFFLAMTMGDYFEYGAFYVIEDVMYQAFRIFAFLSIIIGCMGLYGLASYLAQQRQKEIGVRKTVGASVGDITYLFTKEFTVLVMVAFLIAAPVGYFAMQAWLNTFAYRIELNLWFFMAALLASLLIA
jgi:putative ABC transport system permease protein